MLVDSSECRFRLVAVLRISQPSDHRLRNSPFMFDKSSVRITNKISQSAFASQPTLTSGCISRRLDARCACERALSALHAGPSGQPKHRTGPGNQIATHCDHQEWSPGWRQTQPECRLPVPSPILLGLTIPGMLHLKIDTYFGGSNAD